MGADAFFRSIALSHPGRPGQAFAIGLLCAAGGLVVRLALSPVYGGATGLTLLIPAVLLAALWAGQIAGYTAALASIAGALIVSRIFPGLIAFNITTSLIGTLSFSVVALFGTILAASLRTTLRNLDQTVVRLRESDTRVGETTSELRAMVDQASVGIARVSLSGEVNSANARFAEIMGLASPDDALGLTTADVTHPEDVVPTHQALEVARNGGESLVEKRYIRPDGSIVWAQTSLRPLLAPSGAPLGHLAVVVDITAAKAAEAALRESESRFRLMADTAPSPVWMTNPDAVVEFANTALADFYGVPAEKILGDVWRISVHPDDKERVREAQETQVPSREPFGFEARFPRHDGVWRWMRIAVNPRFDDNGAFLGHVGMAFDVTENHEAMEALDAQERRQRFLLSLSDRIRDLPSTEAVMQAVEAALGAELGADRVGYGEVDQDRGLVSMSRDWTAGVVSAEGQFPLRDLGADLIADLAEGRTIRIADVREDARTRDALEVFERLQTRALMRAPLIRSGRLRAFLYAHHSEVRDWTDDEIGLLQEVADRTWAEIERTRAEAEVRESEQRFRAIADTAPVLIWVTQQDRTRAFVNQAYVAFSGDDYETARLKDWREIIHPDDHERIISESLEGEGTGEPFSMEARYLRHDGGYRWLKSFSRPRFAGDDVVGFVGVAFDVTDIRETQARLLESETRFRTIADSAPAQVWMTDAEGDVIFANRRYKTFFGVTADSELQANWQSWVEANSLQNFYNQFLEAAERHDRFEGLLEVDHPQLGHRWLRCEGVARFDGAGQFQGYVGANIDVTEAKKAETDLRLINELLEERVGEALAEKAKAEADLMHAQRMEAVGRLTGGVAHDFNNLLTVVIGALDMMLKAPEDAARQKKLGEAALAAARRGEGLTHQLLAFSRRQALRPEAVDLNAQIRQSEPLLKRAVGETVEFKTRLRRGGARVHVDPAQFEAALLNLVVNARDAVGEGGGRIVVQTAACSIEAGEVRELNAGDYVCVTVSDDGAGMDPEILGRVFEPFFTTKSVGKGTGLGLSQVYGFARQSGGGVGISSTVGEGTEITLYLPPLEKTQTVSGPEAPAESRSAVEGRSLLLVEDDVGVAAIALEILEGMGLEVRLAESAPRALDILKTERFDLMLSDVVMPGGMTGIELARACARDYPDMRIVLTSGYAGEDVDAALSDAPWPFLRKPYSGQQLAETLGKLTVADAS